MSTNDVFEERMRAAEASKQAGNDALAAGNLKSASFHYKKVYLYLAEYLPSDMAASALASASSSPPSLQGGDGEGLSDNDAANGLVGFLKRRQVKRLEEQEQQEDAAAMAERKKRLYALYGATLNNLTLVSYKLGRYREGVAASTCLLNRVPGFELSPKALLRRAYCYVGLQEPQLAEVNASELEKIVKLAKERCNSPSAALGQGEQRSDESVSPGSSEVIEGLGGMTVAAVAAMQGEAAALHAAIQALKKAGEVKEKKIYQKMFSST